jgi:hypothetical protein
MVSSPLERRQPPVFKERPRMKSCWKSVCLVALAVALAGAGTACGPETKYCGKEHKSCDQAVLDMQAEADRMRAEEAMRSDAGPATRDATIISGADGGS